MTFTAVYDLDLSPPTYDAVAFLLAAEGMRRANNETDMEIVISPGRRGGFRADTLWPQDVAVRRKLLDAVVKPMFGLLPSVKSVVERKGVSGEWGYGASKYGASTMVKCLNKGLRPLRAPQPVKMDRPYVTITLREAEHWPSRNSNVPEWLKAGAEISGRGYRVIFIRDTHKAGEDFPAETDRIAAIDLTHRANLYAGAYMNLGTGNGPPLVSLAMDCPTLIVNPARAGAICCDEKYLAASGFEVGSFNAPGNPPHQGYVWKPDTEENILSGFVILRDRLREAA